MIISWVFRFNSLCIAAMVSLALSFNAEAKTYVLAGLIDYPPYSYQEEGEIRGMDVELAKAMFNRAGHDVKIILMPWKRLLSSARRGIVDGTLGAFITDERKQYLDFIEPVPLRWIQMSLFTYTNSDITDSHLSTLKQHKIGVNRSFSINAAFDSAAERGDFLLYSGNDINQMLKMLVMQRLDGLVHTKEPTLYYLHKMGLEDKIHLVEPPVTQRRGGYMSLSYALNEVERASLKRVLEQVMLAMKEDGSLQAIRARHSVTVDASTVAGEGANIKAIYPR